MLKRHGSLLFLLPVALFAVTAPLPSSATSPGTTRVNVASDGAEANAESRGGSISASGRFVVFNSEASNLVVGDTNDCPLQPRGCTDVFLRDALSGTTELVNLSSDEVQSQGWNAGGNLSSDGRFVTFTSQSSSLVPGDTNGQCQADSDPELENCSDGFVRDRVAGTTERVTVSSGEAEANSSSWTAGISGDGRYVLFGSSASNLVPGDTNNRSDLFIRDRLMGTTELVTVDKDGGPANGGTSSGVLSSDGRSVAFVYEGTDLTEDDLHGYRNIFVRDRLIGQTELVSVALGGGGGNNSSGEIFTAKGPISISADGRYVGFDSEASDLVSGDEPSWDVFVRDRVLGVTSKVSVNMDGSNADGESFGPRVSADGRYVAYVSDASDLVPDDTNSFPGLGRFDVFVRDLRTGTNARASVDSSGSEAEFGSESEYSSISGDGGWVTFGSDARNLVAGDNNNRPDIFLRHLGDADSDGEWDPFDACPTDADCDDDEFTDGVEVIIGTTPLSACGVDAWPPDMDGDGFVDTYDITQMTGRFAVAVPPESPRYDIHPSGFIDTADIAEMTSRFGLGCG